ncbi:anthrax toxin receptor-like isoform X1 [Equus caballus]|uniref:anthrax toxin receptor-like isoform X1 n=1 Tax=Equus caballus TaxID=9796 RepID=UPI0038B35E97
MGSGSPRVPGPVLFLLLLPPPPLQSTESFPSRVPGSRDVQPEAGHQKKAKTRLTVCDGVFDVYFVLDVSDSVKHHWEDVYKFVEEVVKTYPNPKLRMSFIAYSTEGHTLMNLTSDRNEIHDGLDRLKNVVPSGERNMQEGFKKANEQIQQVYSKDKNVSSLIIALTTGPIRSKILRQTKSEANRARNMGATVYSVGFNDYIADQLRTLVLRGGQKYAKDEFKSFDDFVILLVGNSCKEILREDAFFACIGEYFDLGFFSSGLKENKLDEYVCRYKLDTNPAFSKKAISMTKEKLICPGHVFDKPQQKVIVDYSLNNGTSFMGTTLKIISKDCGGPTFVPKKETPVPTTVTEKETPVPTVAPPGLSPDNPLFFPVLVPAVLIIPVLICCIWCCRRTVKEPPPVQKAEKEPETCPTVIVPWCGCQQDRIRWMEGKLDTLCNFVQSCNQVPLMWCQPRDKCLTGKIQETRSPPFASPFWRRAYLLGPHLALSSLAIGKRTTLALTPGKSPITHGIIVQLVMSQPVFLWGFTLKSQSGTVCESTQHGK